MEKKNAKGQLKRITRGTVRKWYMPVVPEHTGKLNAGDGVVLTKVLVSGGRFLQISGKDFVFYIEKFG